MFSNSGSKLKVFAIINFVLGNLGTIVLTIAAIILSKHSSGYPSYIEVYDWWLVFIIPPMGFLGNWWIALQLHAFGQLVESTESMEYYCRESYSKLESINGNIVALAKNKPQSISDDLSVDLHGTKPIAPSKDTTTDDGKWHCRKCGCPNSAENRHCVSCGASKNAGSVTSDVARAMMR